jgi:hypothetical protein
MEGILTSGNFWQGFIIGGTVAGLNHAAHDGNNDAEIEQTKNTGETTTPNEKPYVLNESKRTIHYKPEKTSEAIPLGPGEKTYEPVDGINVRGKVYKVSDGYTSVTVKANFKVYMSYSNSWFYESAWALMKSGLIQRSDIRKDDHSWDNLFNIKK